jgi:hypothetical protein
VVAFAATAPSIGHGWQLLDDTGYVMQQATVRTPTQVPAWQLLATPGMGHPMPVTNASLAIDHALHGVRPAGWHATTTILSALVAALATAWTLTLAGRTARPVRRRYAALGVVAVLSHPMIVEPTFWIAARKDILATGFAAAALLVAARGPWADASGPRRRRTWLATVALLALALGSKSSVVGLPLVLVVLAWIGRSCRHRLIGLAVVGAALSGAVIAATAMYQTTIGAAADADGWAMWWASGCATVTDQLRFFVTGGSSLPVYYPAIAEPGTAAFFGQSVLVLVIVAGPIAMLAPLRRRDRVTRERLALLTLVVLLAPVSGFFGSLQAMVSDRFLFAPLLLGVAPLVAFGLDAAHTRLAQQRTERGVALGLITAVVVLAAAWWPARLEVMDRWRDSETFWKQQLALYPPGGPEPVPRLNDLVCNNYAWSRAFVIDYDLVPIDPDPHRAVDRLKRATHGWMQCPRTPTDCADPDLSSRDACMMARNVDRAWAAIGALRAEHPPPEIGPKDF